MKVYVLIDEDTIIREIVGIYKSIQDANNDKKEMSYRPGDYCIEEYELIE